jgi:hypothetical protein
MDRNFVELTTNSRFVLEYIRAHINAWRKGGGKA